ncbi:hypothetical protein FOZ62_023970, partial [Perkinsus olseni]
MMASHLSGKRVLASILLFVFVALMTIFWRIAKHQQGTSLQATALDGAAVHDNRELFSGEYEEEDHALFISVACCGRSRASISAHHGPYEKTSRHGIEAPMKSNTVQRRMAEVALLSNSAVGATYHFVLLNSTHFLNNICDRNDGDCHLPTEKSSECSTDFYALD